MKKILILGILLFLFTGAFADKLYKGEAKILESRFSFIYKDPKIGSLILKNLEYELVFYTNSALLEIEIESFRGDGGWSKLTKSDIDVFLNILANEIRDTVNKPNLPINIIVEIEEKNWR